MEEFEVETNFPASVKVRGKDDSFNAIITRKIDDKTFPIAALKNLTAAECFTRLGVKVPRQEVEPVEGLSRAVETLRAVLTDFSGRGSINSSEVNDALLDAINDLGEIKKELTEVDE